jgi:hypothetical protein
MNKLTCRGCGKELENCTCNVLTTKKEQTEKLKLIGKDEMLCVSLPFGWCFDEVKYIIEASCIFQLDADQLVVNKLEAERDAAISQVGKLARELGQQDARIKDLESINESHQKLNGELRERIKELEELLDNIPTKDEAIKAKDYLIRTHKPSTYGIHSILNECTLCNFIAKLQKIIDKRG